jgi:hypothetical protein
MPTLCGESYGQMAKVELRSSCIISPRGNTILGDAHPSQREHPVAVTWPRDRRVKAQDSYLLSF